MASTLPTANPCCDNACSGLSVDVVSTVGFLAGYGSPEGVVTGTRLGQLYTDLNTGTKYTYVGNPIGTTGTTTGWV